MTSHTSIYIPRMSSHWTEASISEIMFGCRIGNVSYIDFTSINKKPGFSENIDSYFKSAFIHFSDPVYLNGDEKCSFACQTWIGDKQFWDTIEANQAYKMKVGPKEYWICLKNKNPVQRTLMNIHQVVENGRYLENLVTAQAEEIKNLKASICALQELANGLIHQVQAVHHLKDDSTVCTDNGDENKERISKLEERLKILEDDLSTYGVL